MRNLLRLKERGDAADRHSHALEDEADARTAALVAQQVEIEHQALAFADQTVVLRERTRALESALERAELANRAKDRLLMTVSHELRTPLNTILGWAEMLQKRPTLVLFERALPVIRRNTVAQLHVVNQLLDVATIDTGRMQVTMGATDIRGVVSDAVEVTSPIALAKHVSIVFDDDGTAAIVLGDSVRLQQVLWHLLSNAVKFTPDGGAVHVHIDLPHRTADRRGL